MLCAALLCLLLAGLCSCGQTEVVEEASMTVTEKATEAAVIVLSDNPWGVTIERIDLDDPENQKYIDWAKKHRYKTSFEAPNYFDAEAYRKQADEKPAPWTYVWENKKKNMLREMYQPWNETKELVIRNTYSDEDFGYKELLIRDKATGETECIDKGGFSCSDGVVFDPVLAISDTQFLYNKFFWDGGSFGYYIYDLAIRERICVSDYGLCDLGNEQYLWSDIKLKYMDNENALYLIDMRALEAGGKGAKRMLASWGDYGFGEIRHLSSDKRFVYVNIHRWSAGNTMQHRRVYDISTGELVAVFDIPLDNDHTPT